MDNLLLHPRTKAELLALKNNPPQGLLFIAPHGTGKHTIALTWAAAITAPHLVSVLEPDEKNIISIDATRMLYQRTRGKQAGHQVIIIDHAESMSIEAQNALLKLLEEPRAHITFILTAPSQEALLPTILSRLQTVDILPVSAAVLASLANKKTDQQVLAQMTFVAAGRPATFKSILTDPQVFDAHKRVMLRAKALIGSSPYERLAAVTELNKDRQAAIAILEAMAYMLGQHIRKQPAASSIALANKLQTCLQQLQSNGNLRAQLTYVFAQ